VIMLVFSSMLSSCDAWNRGERGLDLEQGWYVGLSWNVAGLTKNRSRL